MKLTKQRILEIIKEEVEAAKQDSSNTKQKLRMDFINVAKEFLPDADMVASEIELTSAIMNKVLKKAAESGTSATQLTRLNDIAAKLLKEENFNTIVEDQFEEIQDFKSQTLLQEEPSLNNALAGVRRDYNIAIKNNKLDSFVVKYSDGKTPYKFFNELEPEEQDKYKQDIQARLKKIEDSDPLEPETPQDTETQPKEEPKVKTLSSGDKIVPQELPELRKAFATFADIDNGFMQVQYLREQDKMIGDLRTALRKFLGLEGQEKALKEQDEENKKPQTDTSDKRKKLVKSVTRYRRDLNDAGKLLDQYLKSSQAGELKAQLILNKLKDEMQKVQDNNALIVKELMSISNLSESLVLEQESREEKIAKVQSAYDSIVTTLTPALQIQTKGDEPIQQTAEEIQSIVNGAESALEQVDSIKQYFRVTGTFNKPLGELKTDFLEYVAGYKKTMSDLVVDLKDGMPSPEDATKYAREFTRLADKIQEDFGVSPSDVIKVPGLPPVQSSDEASGDNTAAINPSPEAELVSQNTQDDRTEVDPDATTLADPTELMATEIPNLSGEITRHAPKKGPVKDDVYTSLVEKDDQFSDYYSRFLALLSGINRMSKIPDDEPKEIRNSLQLLWRALSGRIDEQKEDNQKPSIFRLQQLTYAMFVLLKSFSSQTSEEDMNKFYRLYQKALILVRKLKNTRNDLVFLDNDDFVNTVLNNTEYFIIDPSWRSVPTEIEESKNLLERLIKQELKVLNGKKMVRN